MSTYVECRQSPTLNDCLSRESIEECKEELCEVQYDVLVETVENDL